MLKVLETRAMYFNNYLLDKLWLTYLSIKAYGWKVSSQKDIFRIHQDPLLQKERTKNFSHDVIFICMTKKNFPIRCLNLPSFESQSDQHN